MNIAFFGTGEFSKNILKDLLKYKEINVKLVVSQVDKAVGRKKDFVPTKVKSLALEEGLEIIQANKLKDLELENLIVKLKALDLDFIIVVAYGKIIPKKILDIPKYGSINIHGSILPKYRGASPVQEALKRGDTTTGLTIMYMSEAMDEGNILKIAKIDIDILDKAADIFKKFEDIGAKLLIDSLKEIISGNLLGKKQDKREASYCKKIQKEDGKIDFKNETSKDIYNKFRAYYTWPGIFTYFNGKKLNLEEIFFDEKIYKNTKKGQVLKLDNGEIGIICSDYKAIILKKIKLEGKKSLDIKDFLNGNKNFIFSIL